MNILRIKQSVLLMVCMAFSGCNSKTSVKTDSSTDIKSDIKDITNSRKADYPVSDFIIKRWSPRAMSGEALSDTELFSLFEAARWAQSEYNNQPWIFIYAKRDTAQWEKLFNLLVDFNKQWAKNAAVLVVIASRNTLDNGEPSISHSFDTGAAYQNLSLQASQNGLVAHGMGGFDHDRAKKDLNIPDGYTVEAMCALGKPGKVEDLPEYMQAKEKPSDRKKITEFVREGSF